MQRVKGLLAMVAIGLFFVIPQVALWWVVRPEADWVRLILAGLSIVLFFGQMALTVHAFEVIGKAFSKKGKGSNGGGRLDLFK